MSKRGYERVSQTVVGGAGKANDAACFMVLDMDKEPWTMGVQRDRRYGDAVCPSSEVTFILAPFPKIMV
jgi:hypothetical protein